MSVLEKLEPGVREGSVDKTNERLLKLRNRPRAKVTRIIKAGPGRTAAIAVTPSLIDLSAPESKDSDPMGISVIGGVGTVLRGPVGFSNRPGDIRIGGMWTFNDLLLSGAPSTMMTPIPVLKFSPPLESIVELFKNVSTIAALAGIL